jgi:hypothetical protein
MPKNIAVSKPTHLESSQKVWKNTVPARTRSNQVKIKKISKVLGAAAVDAREF